MDGLQMAGNAFLFKLVEWLQQGTHFMFVLPDGTLWDKALGVLIRLIIAALLAFVFWRLYRGRPDEGFGVRFLRIFVTLPLVALALVFLHFGETGLFTGAALMTPLALGLFAGVILLGLAGGGSLLLVIVAGLSLFLPYSYHRLAVSPPTHVQLVPTAVAEDELPELTTYPFKLYGVRDLPEQQQQALYGADFLDTLGQAPDASSIPLVSNLGRWWYQRQVNQLTEGLRQGFPLVGRVRQPPESSLAAMVWMLPGVVYPLLTLTYLLIGVAATLAFLAPGKQQAYGLTPPSPGPAPVSETPTSTPVSPSDPPATP